MKSLFSNFKSMTKKKLIIIGIIVALLLAAGGGYWYYKEQKPKDMSDYIEPWKSGGGGLTL